MCKSNLGALSIPKCRLTHLLGDEIIEMLWQKLTTKFPQELSENMKKLSLRKSGPNEYSEKCTKNKPACNLLLFRSQLTAAKMPKKCWRVRTHGSKSRRGLKAWSHYLRIRLAPAVPAFRRRSTNFTSGSGKLGTCWLLGFFPVCQAASKVSNKSEI